MFDEIGKAGKQSGRGRGRRREWDGQRQVKGKSGGKAAPNEPLKFWRRIKVTSDGQVRLCTLTLMTMYCVGPALWESLKVLPLLYRQQPERRRNDHGEVDPDADAHA